MFSLFIVQFSLQLDWFTVWLFSITIFSLVVRSFCKQFELEHLNSLPPPTHTHTDNPQRKWCVFSTYEIIVGSIFFLSLAINGYMYGNQPGLSMCKKDRVSWHMIGMGTDTDMHGVYFQGNTIHLRGTHRDTLALFPHTSTTVFMQPDHAGKLGRTISGDQTPIFRHIL